VQSNISLHERCKKCCFTDWEIMTKRPHIKAVSVFIKLKFNKMEIECDLSSILTEIKLRFYQSAKKNTLQIKNRSGTFISLRQFNYYYYYYYLGFLAQAYFLPKETKRLTRSHCVLCACSSERLLSTLKKLTNFTKFDKNVLLFRDILTASYDQQ
jgi:hypothetical protein